MLSVLNKTMAGIGVMLFVVSLGAACATQGRVISPPPLQKSVDAGTDVDASETSNVDASDDASDSTAVATPVVEKDENWEFTLPSADWKPMPNAPSNLNRALLNDARKNLILFVKEEFKGTCASANCSFMQYGLLAIKDLKDAGGHLESAKSVQISGHPAILLQAVSGTQSSRVWHWITYVDGHGYALSCAGSSTDTTLYDLCMSIGNSVKIN